MSSVFCSFVVDIPHFTGIFLYPKRLMSGTGKQGEGSQGSASASVSMQGYMHKIPEPAASRNRGFFRDMATLPMLALHYTLRMGREKSL